MKVRDPWYGQYLAEAILARPVDTKLGISFSSKEKNDFYLHIGTQGDILQAGAQIEGLHRC